MFDVFSQFRGSKRELFQGILALCLFGLLLPASGQQDPLIINTNHPMDTNVSVGATVRFVTYATSTNFPLSYQWQHEGTNVPGAVNLSLLITNLTVAQAGGYVAWVTNASGNFTNTRKATLTVNPTFTKITSGTIATDAECSMGFQWADYNGDSFLDLYVANVWELSPNDIVTNSFYHNNGDGTFTKIITNAPARKTGTPWTGVWGDYNNDSRLDLFVPYEQLSDALLPEPGQRRLPERADRPCRYRPGHIA